MNRSQRNTLGAAGIAAALGILSEVAEASVVTTSVGAAANGANPLLEYDPVSGEASVFSTDDFHFSLPSLNEPMGFYLECQWEFVLWTPGDGDVSDVDPVVSSGSTLDFLEVGDTVSSASTFYDSGEDGSVGSPPFDEDLYLGYRFQQSGETDVNYGYAVVSISSNGWNDNTITLRSLSYESDAGTGITVGGAPVPEPTTGFSLLLAVSVAWLMRWFPGRRRRLAP